MQTPTRADVISLAQSGNVIRGAARVAESNKDSTTDYVRTGKGVRLPSFSSMQDHVLSDGQGGIEKDKVISGITFVDVDEIATDVKDKDGNVIETVYNMSAQQVDAARRKDGSWQLPTPTSEAGIPQAPPDQETTAPPSTQETPPGKTLPIAKASSHEHGERLPTRSSEGNKEVVDLLRQVLASAGLHNNPSTPTSQPNASASDPQQESSAKQKTRSVDTLPPLILTWITPNGTIRCRCRQFTLDMGGKLAVVCYDSDQDTLFIPSASGHDVDLVVVQSSDGEVLFDNRVRSYDASFTLKIAPDIPAVRVVLLRTLE